MTWFENTGGGVYHVGRILEDGSRSEALIESTVVGEEVEEVDEEEETETV